MASSISLYADGMVIFCHPDPQELLAVRELLRVFGAASGLHTNFQKCLATPIQCSDVQVVQIVNTLSCPIAPFPFTYLGIPLSVRKVSVAALMPLVERMARKLPTWRASLLSRGERLAFVRHVLAAMPTHLLMAMALRPSNLKKINNIMHEFLWHGCSDSSGRGYLVSWRKVCRPLEFGGLSIRDLQRTGTALRARWLWLKATDLFRPWSTSTSRPTPMSRPSSTHPRFGYWGTTTPVCSGRTGGLAACPSPTCSSRAGLGSQPLQADAICRAGYAWKSLDLRHPCCHGARGHGAVCGSLAASSTHHRLCRPR